MLLQHHPPVAAPGTDPAEKEARERQEHHLRGCILERKSSPLTSGPLQQEAPSGPLRGSNTSFQTQRRATGAMINQWRLGKGWQAEMESRERPQETQEMRLHGAMHHKSQESKEAALSHGQGGARGMGPGQAGPQAMSLRSFILSRFERTDFIS